MSLRMFTVINIGRRKPDLNRIELVLWLWCRLAQNCQQNQEAELLLERSLQPLDLAPQVGLTLAHAAVSQFDAEAWNLPFLPPQDSLSFTPMFKGIDRS